MTVSVYLTSADASATARWIVVLLCRPRSSYQRVEQDEPSAEVEYVPGR